MSKRGLTEDQLREILDDLALENEESLDDVNGCSFSSDSSEDSASEDEMPPEIHCADAVLYNFSCDLSEMYLPDCNHQ